MFSERDLIWRRSGHLVFAYDGEMWVWGGMTEHLPEVSLVASLFQIKIIR